MRRLWLFLGASVTVCGCAAALAQTPSATPAAAPIPIEHFTKFDEFGGLRISPDGKFVAVRSGEQGRSRLAFIDLEGKSVVSAVQTQAREHIDTYRWIGPSRLVYTMSGSTPSLAAPIEGCAIYAISRDGSDRQRIYNAYSTATVLGDARSSDSQHVVIAEYPLRNVGGLYYENHDAKARVGRLNLYRDEWIWQREQAPFAYARFLLDHENQVRFTLGTDEQLVPAFGWKPEPEGKWQTFALADFRRDGLVPVRLSLDARSAFLIGVRGEEQFAALFRLDLQTRQLTKVYGFDSADVQEVVMDFARSKIVGVRGYAARSIDHWLEPEDPAAQAYQALHRAFPGQRIQVTSASNDGRWAIVLVDSDINPGDYYLFDTASRKAEFLRAARAWIEPKQMRPKEPIALNARDGLRLHGYVTRPAGDGPHPMVVLPHDRPGERDTWEFDWEGQLLASRGYAVLQVNYRGSAGYGVDFEHAGNREWGGKIQNDIADATRWAVAQGMARADRICIFGAGFGGYAALMGVARDGDLYRCAIGYGTQFDLSDQINRREYSRAERLRMDRVLGNDSAKLRALSPVENAASIDAPVLLIHGRRDWAVDYDQAERMKRALESRRKQVELMSLSREGPEAYDENTRREVYERILQFLDANLRAPQTTAAQ